MRLTAVLAAKTVSALSRVTRRGSGMTYSGIIAERLDPTFIRDMAGDPRDGVIVLTGTNGKTTTAKMLGDALAQWPRTIVRNDSGSNLRQGIASALALAAHPLTGAITADLAVFEVDEATMPRVAPDLSPRLICVTNLFRDQLDRYGDLDGTAEKIREGLSATPGATVLLNADDPIVAGLASSARGPVVTFGIDDPALARPVSGRGLNTAHCPTCGGSLAFARVYYGHLGDWGCPHCATVRPTPEYVARDIELSAESSRFTFVAEGVATRVDLPLTGVHNVYNALAALACATIAGMPAEQAAAAISRFKPAFGRAEKLDVDGKLIEIALAKNPIGAEQAIATALLLGAETIGIALNDNFADGTDVSWIWDIDLDSMDLSRASFVFSGSRAEDLVLRLKYAGVRGDRILMQKNPAEAILMLAQRMSDDHSVYMLATYTAMLELRGAWTPVGDRFSGLGKRLAHDG
ncbi:MAG: DUF1727 domain-containing protein [Coriobacteriia bacterium]|nr:DUF1727 domain-containing protein [Coriobacteriia bacterium]